MHLPSPFFTLLLFLVGAALFIRGKRTKRAGNTPHCRKCDYIMSGDQTRCPECGTILNADTVNYGDGRRRQRLLRAGTISCSIAVLLFAMRLFGFVANHDWTPYKPFSSLLRDMGTGTLRGTFTSPEWQEIQRRLQAGKLSESDQNAIVEKGMPKQKVADLLDWSPVHEFIAQRYAEGRLTAEQEKRYVANMLGLGLKMRTVVGMKGNTPYKIDFNGFVGPAHWRSRYRPVEWWFDDQPAQKFTKPDQMISQSTSVYLLPAIGSPGRHKFHLKVEVETAANALFDAPQSPPSKRCTSDLTATFDAVEGIGPVAMITSPPAEELKKHIKPTVTANLSGANAVQLQLDVGSLPIDVSFDTIVRYGGVEYSCGSITLPATFATHFSGGSVTRDLVPPAVDVILRSTEAFVRDNADIIGIWKGQIEFTNVPVTRVAK